MDSDQLKYLRNTEIDYSRWDHCILNAPNCRVYAMSWFLDCATENWDALIFGDYQYVMPIPRFSKFGLKYVRQPDFCQQLGVFPSPEPEIQSLFALEIAKRFWYIELQLNSANDPAWFAGFELTTRKNHLLPVFETYPTLFSRFSTNAKRNLAKAEKESLIISRSLSIHEFLNHYKDFSVGVPGKNSFDTLKKIITKSISLGNGILTGAYDRFNNLCAGVFLIRSVNRIVYLCAFSTPEGKQNSAMFAIVNSMVKEWAGTGYILDFEGSMIDGVARFYGSFGTFTETYSFVRLNNLPLILKFLKK